MTFLQGPPAPVVVDASALLEAVFDRPEAVDAVRRWTSNGTWLLAPPLIWLEFANSLHKRHRRSAIDTARIIDEFVAAGVETADRGPEGAKAATGLAELHGLSVYDASYLWLAIDVDGELATFDADLARAALAEGVPLVFDLG